MQSWPVDDAAMGRRFQNWFISTCTRASYDGNVFLSRLLKKDQAFAYKRQICTELLMILMLQDFYLWLVILGGSNDARKYRAKITSGDGSGNVTTQSGKVFSIDTWRDKVIK